MIEKEEDFLYKDITYKIRGACFEIWKSFGGAFRESIVDKALSLELKNQGLEIENQKRIDIYYKNQKVGAYIPDKVINNTVMTEVECKPYLTKEDERQFWTYLKGSNYKLGMLINFGSEKLEIKRRIYDKARGKKICDNLRIFPREAKRSASTTKGFTLIELIVVVSVFSIIVLTASVFFVSLVQQQRRALSQQELLNQTSYAVEYMSRALRMAKKDISAVCLSTAGANYELTHGDAGIKFINHSNNDICQEFFLDSSDLNNKRLKESKDDGVTFLPLTSESLQVNYFKIKLSGESDADNLQPRVTLSMEIQSEGFGDQPKKQIQITVSQRNLDGQ